MNKQEFTNIQEIPTLEQPKHSAYYKVINNEITINDYCKIYCKDRNICNKSMFMCLQMSRMRLERDKEYDNTRFIDFWENLDNFGLKEYKFYSTTLINNRVVTTLQRTVKIRCVGGEYMSKEKSQMVFVDEVPEMHKGGRAGYNIQEMLDKIPQGKAWVVTEGDYPAIATVREWIKKNAKDKYNAVQRTGKDAKVHLYVTAKTPEKKAKQ